MELEKHLSKIKARTAAAPTLVVPNFSGKWKNELGSTVTIGQNTIYVPVPNPLQPLGFELQTLAGTYHSTVSLDGGPAWGPLSGFVAGNFIAFTVNWAGLDSLTAWEGWATAWDGSGNPTAFTANWQLVYSEAEGAFNPDMVMTGKDTFAKVE
jgi:hypothetical protein